MTHEKKKILIEIAVVMIGIYVLADEGYLSPSTPVTLNGGMTTAQANAAGIAAGLTEKQVAGINKNATRGFGYSLGYLLTHKASQDPTKIAIAQAQQSNPQGLIVVTTPVSGSMSTGGSPAPAGPEQVIPATGKPPIQKTPKYKDPYILNLF